MIAEIISVGTELLMGQVVNTDAQHIAQSLAPLGYKCLYQITVGDNKKRLEDVIFTALERSDIVLFTGGLGPTDDDLTKETVASALGMTCVPFPEEEKRITERFVSMGRQMTPNNLKQARFPEGSIILPNPFGTAAGCILEKNGKAAILMPGPPRELFPMFDNHVIPYLEKRSNRHLYSEKLQFFGIGESKLTYELRDLIEKQTNPTIASYVKLGETMLRITAECGSDEEGKRIVSPVVKEIVSRMGKYIYSMCGETMEQACVSALKKTQKTVGIAESFSGGSVCASLSAADQDLSVLKEGHIFFSEKLIRTAEEMAESIREHSGADYGLGVCQAPSSPKISFAITDGKNITRRDLALQGDFERNRTLTVLHALDMLRRTVLDLEQLDSIL